MDEHWTWLVNNSSAVMVILTSVTLLWSIVMQIRNERHMNEDIRARLHGSLVNDDLHIYLCLCNIGQRSARDIQIKMNEDLIDVLPTHFDNKIYLGKLNEQSTAIEPGEKIYYLLGSTHLLKSLCRENVLEIRINGKYCKTYKINQVISINEFLNHPPYRLFFKEKVK